MKKIVSVILIAAMCLFPAQQVKAEEIESGVSEIAAELLVSALNHNEYFNLPDLQGKELYLCNPITPYFLNGNTLQANQEIEYYLVKAEDEYIACITLCYKNGIAISATLNTEIASMLNDNIDDDSFLIIANEGRLYLRTEQGTAEVSDISRKDVKTSSEDVCFISVVNEAPWNPCHLVVKAKFLLPSARTISPRSSRILTVPYVSQGDYDLCWAAAAAALGRYYTGDTYSQYSPYALASIVGVGNNGAGIDKAREILETVFHISTIYAASQMSAHTIVTHINEGRPIMVGFSNSTVGHMVVLCGFDDSGDNMQYYVRDSNTPSMQIVMALYSDGPIVMDYYSGLTMYWNEAAYKN